MIIQTYEFICIVILVVGTITKKKYMYPFGHQRLSQRPECGHHFRCDVWLNLNKVFNAINHNPEVRNPVHACVST